MAHVPHVVLPGPWESPVLTPGAGAERHLRSVLRLRDGAAVEYTDGRGMRGVGHLVPGGIARGREERVAPPERLVVAVAPLRAKDRMRFLVEKLTELGVSEVWWLDTRFGQVPAPSEDRVRAWAIGALEQSRGAWLPVFRAVSWADVSDAGLPVAACDPGGGVGALPVPGIVVVGPEGGLDPDEVPGDVGRRSLGNTILRTETAAVAAASLARLSNPTTESVEDAYSE